MPKYLKIALLLLCTNFLSSSAIADPWFTGPILAPAGRTIPQGHTNFQVYGLGVFANGQFDSQSRVHHTPLFRSWVMNPILVHGFTDRIDAQIAIPYSANSTRGVSYHRLNDITVGGALQLVEQKDSNWIPNIRFAVQETFPTGKYEQLNPTFLGTDATGLGSYRTELFLNFQLLNEIYDSHYLRTRLSLSRQFSSSVQVSGFNSFGGTATTQGTVNPGSEDNVILAFEYTLTQNWVAVMEGYYSGGKATRFNGVWNIISDENASGVISGNYYEYGLTPAVEYNFTSNIGLIGGVWFPVAGKNTSKFTTYVLSLNAFW